MKIDVMNLSQGLQFKVKPSGNEGNFHAYCESSDDIDDSLDDKFVARLFEEAPRTKLEHGKMLAMLKREVEIIDRAKREGLCSSSGGYWRFSSEYNDVRKLLAEIEGGGE